ALPIYQGHERFAANQVGAADMQRFHESWWGSVDCQVCPGADRLHGLEPAGWWRAGVAHRCTGCTGRPGMNRMTAMTTGLSPRQQRIPKAVHWKAIGEPLITCQLPPLRPRSVRP